MALVQVPLTTPSDAVGNAALLTAYATNVLILEGIEIPAGTWDVKAPGGTGVVIPARANRTIAGVAVTAGTAPLTTLRMVGSVTSNANMIAGDAAGISAGIVIRDLSIDGGRVACRASIVSVNVGAEWGGGLVTGMQGYGVILAGQNDYASPHNVQLSNVRITDGLTNQTSFNGINTFTWSNVICTSTVAPLVAAHGCDFDTVAYEKPSKFGTFTNCDFDAYGQECFKAENCTDFTFNSCIYRMYVTLTQDNVDVYSSLERFVWNRCTFAAAANPALLKRRRIIGSSFTNLFPNATLVLTGTNTVGGTITASTGYAFALGALPAGHVGAMVGFYSGQGSGACIINALDGAGNITNATVVDIFSSLTLGPGANKWVIAATDNGGLGDLTFNACTFTASGCVYPQASNALNYGTQTFSWCGFSAAGNSYKYPAGVTIVSTGNLNEGLPLKRFVRPTANLKYNGVGGSPITGLNESMARENATTGISNVVTFANANEEVWVLDGVYPGTTGTNRSLNCAGKVITLRAESAFGAVLDQATVGAATGINSTADPAGSLIWGFRVINANTSGNGCGFQVTGGSVTLRKIAAENNTTANNGAGIKVTGGTPTIEDYYVADCSAASTTGGVHIQTPNVTLRRGVVKRCAGGTGTGGISLTSAATGTVVDGVEVSNCTGGVAGFNALCASTVNNLTAVGNIGTAAHDMNVGNGIVVTGKSWILWSDNGTGIKALNLGGTSTLNLTNSTLRGGIGAITGGGPTGGIITPQTADPLFADTSGANYQLQSGSPCLSNGATNAGIYDQFNRPFAYDTQSSRQGAWA
jgi:hypothetical protein